MCAYIDRIQLFRAVGSSSYIRTFRALGTHNGIKSDMFTCNQTENAFSIRLACDASFLAASSVPIGLGLKYSSPVVQRSWSSYDACIGTPPFPRIFSCSGLVVEALVPAGLPRL